MGQWRVETIDIERDGNAGSVVIKLDITPDEAVKLLENCIEASTVQKFEVDKRDEENTAIVWTAITVNA